MQRPAFQDGRILRTSDFVDEQAYHLAEHRRHNRTNHVWGIASGLRVVLSDGNLVVEPGCAVDGFGRDVVLETIHALDLRGFKIRGIEAVDVWAVYNRIRIPARLRIPATGDGVDLLVDTAAIEVTDAADFDPREPPGVTLADLASATTQPPPDDPARRWPVYLGRITRDLTDPETAPNIDLDRRPYIGLVGATVDTSEQFTWLELSSGEHPAVSVKLPGVDNPVLKASAYHGVELNNRLTVDGELAVRSGSVSLIPAPPTDEPLAATGPPEWSLSLAENPEEEEEVTHELRVAMPKESETVPNKLVVGVWRDGKFAPRLEVNENGTVMIAGNLIISGYLKASSVQESQPSEEAKAYLAGLRAINLLTLFQTVTPPASD